MKHHRPWSGLSEYRWLDYPGYPGWQWQRIQTGNEEGSQVDFEWITDGVSIYVDTHGEPFNDTSGYFKSYAITTTSEMKGVLLHLCWNPWLVFPQRQSTGHNRPAIFEGQYKNPHAI